jgi:peptide/nickel transport system substrate-binding protein
MEVWKRHPRSTRFFLAAVIAAGSLAVATAVNANPAGDSSVAVKSHAIAVRGLPKYPDGFPHLDYVNPDAPKGGTLRRGVLGSFDSLNPYVIGGQSSPGMRDYVHESLMARSFDEPFSLYGQLAESIETPPDRSYAAFKIRPEARFSDGSPVTSEDVIFSFNLLKAKGRPFFRTYYTKVGRAEKEGDRGVRFTFAEADREMPLIISLMPIFKAAATPSATFEKTGLTPLIGSGPYVVDEVRQASSITFRRNPDYWGAKLPFNRGLHNFDTIRFEFYRDQGALLDAFRKGLIDVYGDDVPIDANQWSSAFNFPAEEDGRVSKLKFDVGVPASFTAFAFNARRKPFDDKRVREALIQLFDFEWINKTLFSGLYTRTRSVFDRSRLASRDVPASPRERTLLQQAKAEVSPDILEGRSPFPVSDGSGTNREGRHRATALLAEAGYAVRDGVMVNVKTGAPLRFAMLAVNREQERLMLTYARFLKQAGITASVRLADSAQYQRQIVAFDFDVIQISLTSSLSPGNEQNFRWSSRAAGEQGSFNYAGVVNPAVDALIAEVLKASDEVSFTDAVRALDRTLLSGSYVLPLFYPDKQWMVAWSRLGHPAGSTLFGARLETWWVVGNETAVLN